MSDKNLLNVTMAIFRLQNKHLANSIFLQYMNSKKWSNGFNIEFRQHFAKETFSYDEYLKS